MNGPVSGVTGHDTFRTIVGGGDGRSGRPGDPLDREGSRPLNERLPYTLGHRQ